MNTGSIATHSDTREERKKEVALKEAWRENA